MEQFKSFPRLPMTAAPRGYKLKLRSDLEACKLTQDNNSWYFIDPQCLSVIRLLETCTCNYTSRIKALNISNVNWLSFINTLPTLWSSSIVEYWGCVKLYACWKPQAGCVFTIIEIHYVFILPWRRGRSWQTLWIATSNRTKELFIACDNNKEISIILPSIQAVQWLKSKILLCFSFCIL